MLLQEKSAISYQTPSTCFLLTSCTRFPTASIPGIVSIRYLLHFISQSSTYLNLIDRMIIHNINIHSTSSSRASGGGSFKRKKNYIAKKEFAYRMCARRPTSAMPKPIFWCEQAFCRSMVVMSCALRSCVLMSWGRWRDWDEVMWLVVRWPVVS